MPLINAVLNSVATVLLLAGFAAIKARKNDLHRNLMLTAFGVSMAFLACYLTYHFGRHHYLGSASATFPGTGTIRTVYLSILATHILLAVAVPVLAITTIVLGFRQKWERHRRWANLAFPIWLYVSVTGVVIYAMNAAYGAYEAT
jgi:protein SCO1/2/putative membrane protein